MSRTNRRHGAGSRLWLVMGLMGTAALPGASRPQALPPRPDHVVIVMEENHSYSEIIGSGSAPYINNLAGQGVLFTQYFAQYHPSEQNYLEILSGSDQGIGTSDPNPAPGSPFTAANWGGELLSHGFTFTGYSQGLPSTGYSGADTGAWAYRHCPWIAFQGNGTNQIPASDNVAFSSFPANFANLPTVSMVTPDLNGDMHDGTIQQGDSWLQTNIDAYAQWAKTHNSLLIVVWDEDDGSQGNQVAMIMVGQAVQVGIQNSQSLDHDSLCRLICDLYGLPTMGGAVGATAITGVWSTGSVAPTITSQPSNQTVTVGQTAQFQVSASGTAPLSYQWEKNSVAISGANGASYTTPPALLSDNNATFLCVVKNPVGTATSAQATLTVNPTPGSLPSPWADQDIGQPGVAGQASFDPASGIFTVQGGGADIFGTTDQFNFAYQTLSGDGQIAARVAGLGNTNAWAKAGVMIRASLPANSGYAYTAATSSNGVVFQHRLPAGTGVTALSDQGPLSSVPTWVKLVRTGNSFTSFTSTDGTTWTQIGSAVTISMGASALIGFAVTSHDNTVSTTANFDSTSGSGGWTPPPGGSGPPPGGGSAGGGGGGHKSGGCGATGLDGILVLGALYLASRRGRGGRKRPN